jgi:hypothetical protein
MAVVAAYSLLETVLLLTYLRFDFETEKYKLYAIFGFSLYFTLPFGAAFVLASSFWAKPLGETGACDCNPGSDRPSGVSGSVVLAGVASHFGFSRSGRSTSF